MKRSHVLAGSVLTLALTAFASGCVVRARPAPVAVSGGVYVDGSSDYATVYPTTFAPEPIPEYRPAAPGYGYTVGGRVLGLERLRLVVEQRLLGA